MMKSREKILMIFLFAIMLAACESGHQDQNKDADKIENSNTAPDKSSSIDSSNGKDISTKNSKVYSNEIFKEVTVTQTGEDEFLIKRRQPVG